MGESMSPGLSSCTFQVESLGGGFVAPDLRERVRVETDMLRLALRVCESQVVSMKQKIALRPSLDGPVLQLSPLSLASSDSAMEDDSGGVLCPDTQIEFVSGPSNTVRLMA